MDVSRQTHCPQGSLVLGAETIQLCGPTRGCWGPVSFLPSLFLRPEFLKDGPIPTHPLRHPRDDDVKIRAYQTTQGTALLETRFLEGAGTQRR